jgi:hypothetical protein
MQLLLLELNEVNFEHLRMFAARGYVPTLARLLETHGIAETTSENRYDHLEPWIQWVTAHTGLTFGEHGVFRLGDIVDHDIAQIWEGLEQRGLRVGAISPMNAKNRTRDAAFFVPDPWTSTMITGPTLLRHLHEAVAQAVNDNAQARLTPRSAAWIALGTARYARPANYTRYARLAVGAIKKPWAKAMFLDLLLADVFIRETWRAKPHFASLFLNAAAHIQHHYMFNSMAYTGTQKNPEWYVARDEDPVREIYQLYDRIVGQIQEAFPRARLMLATGLHQDPHPEVTFYWRLKDHGSFLRKLGVPFEHVAARMSRDFVVACASESDAATAENILASAVGANGTPLFEVDNRGRDVFAMLTWPHDIGLDFVYTVRGRRFERLADDVAFVAIKNGEHNGIGYFIDTGVAPAALPGSFPLKDLPARVYEAFGVPQ